MSDPTPSASPDAHPDRRTALVTGASGYIGGLVVPLLLADGWQVRVLTRRPGSLEKLSWSHQVEVVEGSASSTDDLRRGLDGADVGYYLIHSMDGEGDFAGRDRTMARSFGSVAQACGVRRIVYLGGLHPGNEPLSPHLASRVEVGAALMNSGVPTAVLQVAVVLGDGSVSFDMLRYLSSRLPAMVAPKWLANRIQPIAAVDVAYYLVAAADLPAQVNRTFDVGGPEVLTYADMLNRFAGVMGWRRRVIKLVPVLTPWLASHWIGLITPVSAGVAKPLVGSLIHEVVCSEHDIDRFIDPPPGGLTGFDDAVRSAMSDIRPDHGPRAMALTLAATGVAAVILAGDLSRQVRRWR